MGDRKQPTPVPVGARKPPPPPAPPMRARAPEKIVQLDVKRLYRQFGGVVYDFSQPRASMQTPGIADLLVCFPNRECAFWQEVKTEKGQQTLAQEQFQALMEQCGIPYVLGGTTEALEQLKAIGFRLELG